MSSEQNSIDEANKRISQALHVAQDLTHQLGQTAQDGATYGTLKKGKYETSNENHPNFSEKINIGQENEKSDKVTVEGYYNKSKIDMTLYANSVVEATQTAYSRTDSAYGQRMADKYLALIGSGSISRNVAVSDLRHKFYGRDNQAAKDILQNHAKQMHQKAVVRENANPLSGGKVYELNDASLAAHAKVNDILSKNNIQTNLSEGEIIRALSSGKIGSQKINMSEEVKDALNQRRFQIRMDESPKVNFYAGIEAGHTRVIDNYNNNARLINSFLDSRGINSSKLNNMDLRGILNSGKINAVGGGTVAIDNSTKIILQEKMQMNNMAGTVNYAKSHKGGVKNTARAWIQEGMGDTDAAQGYRNAKMTLAGAKVTGVAMRGAAGATGMAAIKSLEATGRIGVHVAKGATNFALGTQKILIGNNAAARSKNIKITQNINEKLSKIDSKIKVASKSGTSGAAWFAKTSGKQKVRYIAKAGASVASKWHVVKKVTQKKDAVKAVVKNSKAGNMYSATSQKIKAFQAQKNKILNRISKHTRIVRAPFTAFNAFNRLIKGLVIKVGLAFLFLCLIVAIALIPIAGFTAIIPDIFLADDSYSITNNVGVQAVASMLQVQQDYLKEVEDYMDATCTLEDEDENKLHPHHTAYYATYYGDFNDEYATVSAGTFSSYQCKLTTGEFRRYDIADLYKTIISMATVATGNESEDSDFYVDYCSNLLRKILHSSTFIDTDDGAVAITLSSAGLTNGMRLDAQNVSCVLSPGCSQSFQAANNDWMHQHGADSMEYSESYRTSQNYNTWDGWITNDKSNFEWAQSLYELSNEDWLSMNIELPGSLGYNGGSPLSEEQLNAILENLETELSASDSPSRSEAIQKAINEMNRLHVYSNVGPREFDYGDDLAEQLDCSSFVLGVLQTVGVRPSNSGGSTETCKSLPDETSLRPGDILLKYNAGQNIGTGSSNPNHVMLFIGYDSEGKPQTIECGGGSSSTCTARNGAISIHTYSSVSAMTSTRGITYIKNPYGD